VAALEGRLRPHIETFDRGESDIVSVMQRAPSSEVSSPVSEAQSSHSVIPEDWLIDLQRLVQRLERQCTLEYPEEVLFTVYTWYLDHAISPRCVDPKLATLGGNPDEWEQDLLFPWTHRIRPESYFLDLVAPSVSRLSIEEHIAHVIITQRQSDLISILLVIDFSRVYSRRFIIRKALAVPKTCTLNDIAAPEPIVEQHLDNLVWEHPELPDLTQPFRPRNGMSLQLKVLDTDASPRDLAPDAFSILQISFDVCRDLGDLSQADQSHFVEKCRTLESSSIIPTGKPPGVPKSSRILRRGIDLPPENDESNTYEFNIHAPPFYPGNMPQEQFPEYVHELFDTWGENAFSWQGEVASAPVVTWFINHLVPFPVGIESRIVHLFADVSTWDPMIRRCWHDVIDPQQTLDFRIVDPAPPQLEPGVVAHLLVIQAMQPAWASSLISVDDTMMTNLNDGQLMRLVGTTNVHFTANEIVNICGYPVDCLYPNHPVQCQVIVQDMQVFPGNVIMGRTGNSILLQIIHPIPQIQGGDQDNLGIAMYQTGVELRGPTVEYHKPKHGHQSSRQDSSCLPGDIVSLMAQGRRARKQPDPPQGLTWMPQAVQQEDHEEEFPDMSDDDLSSTDSNWQETVLFTTTSEPVTRQLNMVSLQLRFTQIASALRWDISRVHSEFILNCLPSDLEEENLYGRLIRHTQDLPPFSDLVLVLIDTTFHPIPPSWRVQLVRKAMYSLPRLTAVQFLRSMFLARYCEYNQLPCIVYRNNHIWLQDSAIEIEIANGDYIRVEVPPPNEEQRDLDTRCVAVATHQGIDMEILHLLGGLTEAQMQVVPNQFQVMLEQDILEEDSTMNLVQVKSMNTHSVPSVQAGSVHAFAKPWNSITTQHHVVGPYKRWKKFPHPPSAGPRPQGLTPRIQATLGHHNAWQIRDGDLLHSPWEQMMYLQLEEPGADHPRPCQRWNFPPNVNQVIQHEVVEIYSERCRLGEASVPGPADPDHADQPSPWAIGAINPTGVAGKAVLFADLPPGIYALSETHLTTRGRSRFMQEVKYAKLSMRLTTGHDAPYKKEGLRAIGGKHTGVGFLSTYPVRSILSGWDPELYRTSRLHAATFQVHQTCIAGAVCYGYAHAADSKQTQEQTDRLLQQLTHQIVLGFPGPAFVAGDFNQVSGVLHEPQIWEARGWREIQTWANEQFGISPTPTCCHTSRKDFVYMSPQLQQLLKSCQNSFDKFPDHSTLIGLMELPSKPQPIARWPQPHQIDYQQVSIPTIASSQCAPAERHADPTAQYTAICKRFEEHVDNIRAQQGAVRLTQNQCGRAQTLQRTFTMPKIAAIRPARPGDVHPTVNSWSMQHCRWLTRCRRIDNYVKQVRKNSSAFTAIEQRAALWRSIRHAPGFPGGFMDWWLRQAAINAAMLPWLPQEPPALAIAVHVQEVFTKALQSLEKQIITTRVALAKSNRASDINRVFRDVRKPPPVPVHMLVAKASATITEIVDEGSVIVDDTRPIQHASVLETRTGPMHIIHIEEQQIWFTSPHTLVVGDVVAEVNMQGQIHEIHQTFVEEWTKRWDRHRNLDPHHWTEILELTETLLQCPPMVLQPITLSRWKQAIKSKKASSATGLDGVSRRDLLAFPDELHIQLLEILEQAETTGQWPLQLLCGAVHSLEKIPNAQNVAQYRPITIMPLVYRIYTTLRSREVLQHLAKYVPPTLLGNMPGKQATSLWWSLQHRVELALQMKAPLTGATSDLIKAFNHLPREVTFQIAKCMGVHPRIITAWTSATVFLKRHFVVRNSPSQQVTSTTGFVEGCGMSVVAMVLVNTLIHAFLQCKHPETVFTTYVDNFELQAEKVSSINEALESLDGFCRLLDIQLDPSKTVRWACTAEGRHEIRAAQEVLITSARDLGAHMQFDARRTNITVVNKFKQLPALWHQLARSQAPLHQKLRVLRSVAWPRAMYAISTVHIGPAHFVEARAGAFNALGLTKAGANPQIFLSLVSNPMTDPEFYALWITVTQFRREIPPELLDVTLAPSAAVPPRLRKPGPGGVLLSRLQQVCWTYQKDGVFHDGEGGHIHILHTPIQELRHRLTRAWQQSVGHQWEHRQGFAGLRHVCPKLSKADVSLSPDELGFIRTAQTGVFYTQDTLIHAGFTDSTDCKFCSSPDSVEHRHWECPATQSSRDLIPRDIQDMIASTPACLREHGFATEHPLTRAFKMSLKHVPDSLSMYVSMEVPTRHMDLFCDGTGLDPTLPEVRLVAWGVVLAGGHPLQPHVPVAWGGVPGFWQTVVRAELCAFVSALQFGVQHAASFAIWSDCEYIIKRARAIQKGVLHISPSMVDHDLWQLVNEMIPPQSRCALHHIKSHQSYGAEEEWIQWACSANDSADQLADFALRSLPEDVLRAQRLAKCQYVKDKQMIRHVHSHMIRVAKLSTSVKDAAKPAPVRDMEDMPEVNWSQIARVAIDRLPIKLRFVGVHRVLEWCQWVHDENAPLRWVSWYELLFSFQILTGEWGIQSTSAHNTWQLFSRLEEYQMKQVVRSWSSYLIQLIRLQDPEYKAVHNRPSNGRFQCCAMGVSMKLNPVAEEQLHLWFQGILGDRLITKVTQLQQLPVASLEVEPEKPKLRHGLHQFFHSS